MGGLGRRLRRAAWVCLMLPVAEGGLQALPAAQAATHWSAPYAGRQLAVDSAAERVLVLADDGSVTTLNGRTGARLNTVAVGQQGVWGPGVVDERAGRALFLLSDGGTSRLAVLDTHAGTVIAVTSLPAPSSALVEDPRTQLVYVAGSDAGGTIAVVDARSGQVTGTLQAGAPAAQITVDSPAQRLLVLTAASASGFVGGQVQGAGALRVLDLATTRMVASIATGGGPAGLAVDGANGHAFVSNASERTISIIDDRAGQLLATVRASGSPGQVLVDSAHGRAYVLDPGTWQGGGAAGGAGPSTSAAMVDVLNTGSGAVVQRIPVGAPARAISLDAGAGLLFVGITYTTPVGVQTAAPDALVGGIRVIRTGASPRRTNVYWPAGASPAVLVTDAQHGRLYVLSAGSTTRNSGTVPGFVSVLDEAGY